MNRTKTLIQLACEKLPPLYSTDGQKNALFKVKIVAPFVNFEWWLKEYDPQTNIAFGFACLNDPYNAELGSISITELEHFNGNTLILLDDTYSRHLTWAQIKAECDASDRKTALEKMGK